MSLPLNRRRFELRRACLWAVLALSPALAGCAFTPLYGVTSDGTRVSSELSYVAIPEVETRLNQLIRNRLISTMSPPGVGGEDRYVLEFVTSAGTFDLVLEQNEDVSRRLYRLNVTYTLKDNQNGDVIHQGHSFSHVAYDRIASEFTNIQAQKNAEERAAIEVAEDIRTRLAAYFSTR
jgi:LPS-assembly lipoprotein